MIKEIVAEDNKKTQSGDCQPPPACSTGTNPLNLFGEGKCMTFLTILTHRISYSHAENACSWDLHDQAYNITIQDLLSSDVQVLSVDIGQVQSNISQGVTEQPELLEMESPMKTNKRSKNVSNK